jgi:hypothetical protein
MMTPYHAFLLRLWRMSEMEPPVWHVSLENPHTREVQGFDNLDTLLDYLLGLTRESNLPSMGECETQAWPTGSETPATSGSSGGEGQTLSVKPSYRKRRWTDAE